MATLKKKYWLMKSEPHAFSMDDLRACGVTDWDGVRNYQARNFMRDEMRRGDGVLFYHSSARPSGIAGEAKVIRESHPDDTAFDPRDHHYDPRSDPANPTWYCVDVQFVRACRSFIPLDELRRIRALRHMVLLRRSRLSVQPVTHQEWQIIMALPHWK